MNTSSSSPIEIATASSRLIQKHCIKNKGIQTPSKTDSTATAKVPADDINDTSAFIPIEIRIITLRALIADNRLPLSDVHCVNMKSHQLLKIILLNSI